MTIETRTGDAALPDDLRSRWHDESLGSVWLRPADWYHPAVDALALALLTAGDVHAGARELGRARGDDGVGIGEALDDLACLYRVTGNAEPPLAVVRALAEGWAEAEATALSVGAAVDPTSGLPTRAYLALRLAEQYADAPPRGWLLLVDVAVAGVSRAAVSVWSAAVGGALGDTFGAGHPMAALGGGAFAVLVRPRDGGAQGARDHDLVDARLAELRVRVRRAAHRMAVDDLLRDPLHARLVPLPASHREAVALLERAAHAH